MPVFIGDRIDVISSDGYENLDATVECRIDIDVDDRVSVAELVLYRRSTRFWRDGGDD